MKSNERDLGCKNIMANQAAIDGVIAGFVHTLTAQEMDILFENYSILRDGGIVRYSNSKTFRSTSGMVARDFRHP